jgi:hypothetical protein
LPQATGSVPGAYVCRANADAPADTEDRHAIVDAVDRPQDGRLATPPRDHDRGDCLRWQHQIDVFDRAVSAVIEVDPLERDSHGASSSTVVGATCVDLVAVIEVVLI